MFTCHVLLKLDKSSISRILSLENGATNSRLCGICIGNSLFFSRNSKRATNVIEPNLFRYEELFCQKLHFSATGSSSQFTIDKSIESHSNGTCT